MIDILTLETDDPLLYDRIRSQFGVIAKTCLSIVRILDEDWSIMSINIDIDHKISHDIRRHTIKMQRLKPIPLGNP